MEYPYKLHETVLESTDYDRDLKIEIIKFHPRGIIKTDSRMFFQNYI
jgi:hypothetical protein